MRLLPTFMGSQAVLLSVGVCIKLVVLLPATCCLLLHTFHLELVLLLKRRLDKIDLVQEVDPFSLDGFHLLPVALHRHGYLFSLPVWPLCLVSLARAQLGWPSKQASCRLRKTEK